MIKDTSLSDHKLHTITDIASRNHEIGTITVPSGTAQGTTVFEYDPSSYFTDILNVSKKIDGFLGLDTIMKIMVKPTTERQSQGGLSFVTNFPQAKTPAEQTDFLSNVILWSTCATHFNVVTETSVEIKINYQSTSMIYSPNTTTDESDVGFWPRVYMKVLVPYISPTGSDLKLTVFASLEQLNLYIPIVPSIKPPTGMENFGKLYKLLSIKPHYKITPQDLLEATNHALEQMHVRDDSKIMFERQSNNNVIATELKQEENGKISEFITSLDTAIQKLPKVPYLEEVQKISKVAAPPLSELARAFGMSKPEDHSIAQRVEQLNSQNMHNIDGAVNSYNLGNSAHQNSAVASLARTPIDDMAFITIAQRPAIIYTGEINTTMAPGTLLFSQAVSPFRFKTGTYPVHVPSPLSWISSMARFWTGDIKFKFTFYGNNFMSYMLNACMFYNVPDTDITNNYMIDENYNMVIDGTNLTSTIYSVEYKAQNPWKETMSDGSSMGTGTPSSGIESLGTMALFLKNKLICSSSTSDNLKFTVEVFAGDNFELQTFRSPTYTFMSNLPTIFERQSDTEAFTRSTADTITTPMVKQEPLTAVKNAFIFGQQLKSIKQINNTETYMAGLNLNLTNDDSNLDTVTIYPFSYLRDTNVDNVSTWNILSFTAAPFAFISGDIQLSVFILNGNNLDGSMLQVKYDPNITPSDQGAPSNTRLVRTNSMFGTVPNATYFLTPGPSLLVQRTLQSRTVFKVPNFNKRPIFLRPTQNWEEQILLGQHPPGGVTFSLPPNTTSATGLVMIRFMIRGADNMRYHIYNGLNTMRDNQSVFTALYPKVTPPTL